MTGVQTCALPILGGQLEGISEEEVLELIEIPQDSNMGDYAFPCFRLAKIMKKSPQSIAADIAEAVKGNELFEKVEQVNAYVNMFLSKRDYIKNTLREALDAENFGKLDIGEGKMVIVEYSSPNIAKPFHIGHIRSTVIGNAIYLIYAALGYKVRRLNHVGDYGTQFGKMIVAYRHWGNEEDVKKSPITTLLAYYTKFHVEAEKHPELEDDARKAFADLENAERSEERRVGKECRSRWSPYH